MVRELPSNQTALAFGMLSHLRPGLGKRDEFVARVNELMRPEGYRLVAAFDGNRR